jgi:hypothetical protein
MMKKKMTLLVTTTALLMAWSVNAADETRREIRKEREAVRERAERAETKSDIENRIQALNRLDNNPSSMRVGMAAVSKETAVPLPKIEAEHKEHPSVGLAGLFVAHELATRTHKPVEHFLKARASGKSWTQVAAANGQNLDVLENKLARIEAAVRDAK